MYFPHYRANIVFGFSCFGLGLSGFGLEFGDGGVVFGLGIIFQNDFLRCMKADNHVFDSGDVGLPLTDFFADFFAGFLALLIRLI